MLFFNGLYQWGKASIVRAYQNGASTDFSTGSPQIKSKGGLARIEWRDLEVYQNFWLTPYAQVSGVNAQLEAYVESGGAFPALYQKRNFNNIEARVGLKNIFPFNHLKILTIIEGVHNFRKPKVATQGALIGLFDFNLPSRASSSQSWINLSFGPEYQLESHLMGALLNVFLKKQDPSISLSVFWNF